jgi:DME family drug/metabolite transporter
MTPTDRTSTRTGLGFVFVAAVAWGTGGAAAAVLYRSSGLGPVAVSFWRLAVGVAVLAAVLLVRRRLGVRRATPVPARRGRRLAVLAVTGVGLAVYQTAFFAAIAEVGLGVSTVVTLGAGPVVIATGAHVLLKERLGYAGLASVTLALLGLLLLAGDGGPEGRRPALGIALCLLSAAGYAVVTLLTRRVGAAGDPYDTALAGFAVALACLFPLALIEGLLPSATGLPATVGWLVYLGFVPTALAYGLFFAGLARIRAATASIVALVEPVTGAAIGVLWLGERLTGPVAIGSLVLLTAVATLSFAERRGRAPQVAEAAG